MWPWARLLGLSWLMFSWDINNCENSKHVFYTRSYSASIFHKTTFTGLMMNFLSYNPLSFILAIVRTLVHMVHKICNNTKQFHADLLELKHILARKVNHTLVTKQQMEWEMLRNPWPTSTNCHICLMFRKRLINKLVKFVNSFARKPN